MENRLNQLRIKRIIKSIKHEGSMGSKVMDSLVKFIIQERDLIYRDSAFYEYKESGVWVKFSDDEIKCIIKGILDDRATRQRLSDLFELLRLECCNRSSGVKIDRDLINIRNGFFNTKTLEMKLHDRDNFSACQLPVIYNPQAACPLWLKTLDEIFEDDQEKIKFLQEIFGYALTCDTHHHKAFFFYGKGRNGKSVVTNILMELVGKDNYSAISLSDFGKDFYLVRLENKLVNISTETGSKIRLNEAIFKSVVAGEPVPACYKFKPVFDLTPYAKIIVSMNDLPVINDKSEGCWERIEILKFNRFFKEEERNKYLTSQILDQGLDGIFTWAIDGLDRLRKNGRFIIPQDSRKELEEFRRQNNTVQLFIEEKYDFVAIEGQKRGQEGTMPASDLFAAYQNWCQKNSYKFETPVTFSVILLQTFQPRIEKCEDSGGRYYKGLKQKKG